MTTAQDQQSRAAYEDGKWYWVEKESWVGQPPTVAPACYRADCDAWYSYVFSGITTRYLKVLEPCEMRVARTLPASMKPVAEIYAGDLFRVNQGPDAEPVTGDHDLYTAAQVLAMGRVPPGWQITEDMHIAAVKVLHRASGVDGLPQRMVDAMLAAAPRPPIAQKRYRLLVRNVDTIQADDEFLRDADSNWQIDPQGIFVGMTYMSNVLLPARRAIEPAP